MGILNKLLGKREMKKAILSSPEFVPNCPLEHQLVAAQNGEISEKALSDALITSQAVTLLDKAPPPSGVWDNSINPLILNAPQGFPVLALFSSPERATNMTRQFEHYNLALLVEVKWLLRGVQSNVGLVMNPGHRVGFQLPPDGVAKLKNEHGIG